MDARVILRDKGWALACCLALLGAGLCFILPRGFISIAAGDIIQSGLILLALRSCLANIRTTEHRSRLFWILLSLGFALWLSAQLLWTYFEVMLDGTTSAVVRRFQATAPRRTRVTFALTHEGLLKLVNDLLGV